MNTRKCYLLSNFINISWPILKLVFAKHLTYEGSIELMSKERKQLFSWVLTYVLNFYDVLIAFLCVWKSENLNLFLFQELLNLQFEKIDGAQVWHTDVTMVGFNSVIFD